MAYELRYIIYHSYIWNIWFYISGFLYDVTGNYDIPFYVTGSMQVIGGVILCVVAVLHKKRTRTTDNKQYQHNEISSICVTWHFI